MAFMEQQPRASLPICGLQRTVLRESASCTMCALGSNLVCQTWHQVMLYTVPSHQFTKRYVLKNSTYFITQSTDKLCLTSRVRACVHVYVYEYIFQNSWIFCFKREGCVSLALAFLDLIRQTNLVLNSLRCICPGLWSAVIKGNMLPYPRCIVVVVVVVVFKVLNSIILDLKVIILFPYPPKC